MVCFYTIWVALSLGVAASAISDLINGSTTCLHDAVPIKDRKYVTIDGVEQPVGFLLLDWQSATLNGEIFRLIVEEVLGYHAKVTARSAIVQSGLWGIVGCKGAVGSEAEALQKCEIRPGKAVSETHLCFETWDFYLPATLKTMRERHAQREPVKLGTNLGFQGLSANWVPREITSAAQKAEGLYLGYYKSFNDSKFDAFQYFDTVEHINTTEFFNKASKCKDYAPMNEDLSNRDYIRHFPDDTEGVEIYTDASGATKYRGRCLDGVWWLSPACRANRSRCIPYITILGYGYSVIQHKAIHYNIAVAMASTDDWVGVIHKNKVLNYAWIPDANFVDRGLQHLLFPAYVREEHEDHLYTSEFAQVETEKWGHRDLQSAAPRIWEAAIRMGWKRSMVQSVLEDQRNKKITAREAACIFLKNNRPLWAPWIPDVTRCAVGQGLTTVDGELQCAWCPRATYSVPHPNITGSRLCLACPPGRFQENTQATECLPCVPGTIAATAGNVRCSRCDQGRFQALTGKSSCDPCSGVRTTAFQGASRSTECICPVDTYEPATQECRNGSCSCKTCGEGLSCKMGSRLFDWEAKKAGNLTAREGAPLIYPKLLPMYFSSEDQPVSVYSCVRLSDCPGGDPGECGINRKGRACAKCEEGYFEFDGDCTPCSEFEMAYILFPTLPAICSPALVILFYTRLLEPFRTKNVDSMKNQAMSVGFTVVVLAQTLALLQQCRMRSSPSVTALWEISGFSTRGLDILRPECSGGGGMMDFKSRFIMKTLLPVFVAIYFLVTMLITWFFACVVKLLSKRLSYEWVETLTHAVGNGMSPNTTFNTFGTAMYTFSIAVVSIAFQLFKCFDHPNGMSSLVAAADVICYEGDWNGLTALGAFAILIYCVGAMTLFGYVLHISPSRFPDEKFRAKWKFLLVKWRPGCWWFGQVFLIKGLSLNLALVLFKHGALQLWWMAASLVVYIVPVLRMHPWRHFGTNYSDAITAMCMTLVAVCGVYNTEQAQSVVNTFDILVLVLSITPVVVVAVAAVSLFFRYFHGPDPEGVDGVRTALFLEEMLCRMNSQGLDELLASMANTTGVDRAGIRNMMALLASEMSRIQIPGNRRLIQRSSSSNKLVAGEPWSVKAETKVRDFCSTVPDVDIEVKRVFGAKKMIPAKQFHALVAAASDSRCADLMMGLLDLYEEGTITRDVYQAFLVGIRKNEPWTTCTL